MLRRGSSRGGDTLLSLNYLFVLLLNALFGAAVTLMRKFFRLNSPLTADGVIGLRWNTWLCRTMRMQTEISISPAPSPNRAEGSKQ
jgi:hypothetical protein